MVELLEHQELLLVDHVQRALRGFGILNHNAATILQNLMAVGLVMYDRKSCDVYTEWIFSDYIKKTKNKSTATYHVNAAQEILSLLC